MDADLLISARPAFEDEAVQAVGGSGGAAPRGGTGRGGGGEKSPGAHPHSTTAALPLTYAR